MVRQAIGEWRARRNAAGDADPAKADSVKHCSSRDWASGPYKLAGTSSQQCNPGIKRSPAEWWWREQGDGMRAAAGSGLGGGGGAHPAKNGPDEVLAAQSADGASHRQQPNHGARHDAQQRPQRHNV